MTPLAALLEASIPLMEAHVKERSARLAEPNPTSRSDDGESTDAMEAGDTGQGATETT